MKHVETQRLLLKIHRNHLNSYWTPTFFGGCPLGAAQGEDIRGLEGVEPGRTTPNKGWFANPIPLMLNNGWITVSLMRQKQKWRHEKYIPLLNHGFGDRGYWTFDIGGTGLSHIQNSYWTVGVSNDGKTWFQWWKHVMETMMETMMENMGSQCWTTWGFNRYYIRLYTIQTMTKKVNHAWSMEGWPMEHVGMISSANHG